MTTTAGPSRVAAGAVIVVAVLAPPVWAEDALRPLLSGLHTPSPTSIPPLDAPASLNPPAALPDIARPEAAPVDPGLDDFDRPDSTNEDLSSVPDLDTITRLVRENPAALGPLSIGTPDAGLLLNPYPLEESPLWSVRDPSEAYATNETVAFIATAVTEVERRFPGSPRIVIGDLSRSDGGRLNRHRSIRAAAMSTSASTSSEVSLRSSFAASSAGSPGRWTSNERGRSSGR